jgi:hypothetical protein
MTELEVLKGARELLSDRKRWTKHAYARDLQSTPTNAKNPTACKWCLAGAFSKISVYEDYIKACDIITRAISSETKGIYVFKGLTIFNDTHTHREVLAILDKAIELCA